MAIVVKNTNYNGEVLERILTVATTNNEIVAKGLIHVIPGVEKKISIPRLHTGKMLQKRKENPTVEDSKGNFNYSEKSLDPKDCMVFTVFNPRTFENIWRKWQPKGDLVFAQLPPEAQNALLDALSKQVQFELGGHYVNGVYGDTDDELFDGILTQAAKDEDVIVVSSDATKQTDRLKAVRKAIPVAIRNNHALRIIMSVNDFDEYDDELTAREGKNASETEVNRHAYKGIKIETLADWPDDLIVASLCSPDAMTSNFFAAVNLQDDEHVIQIDKVSAMSELYFFKMLMKVDTNIAFGEEFIALDKRQSPAFTAEAPAAPAAPAAPTFKSGAVTVNLKADNTPAIRSYATSNGADVTAEVEDGVDWLEVEVDGNKVTFTPQAFAYDSEAAENTRSATVTIGIEGAETTKTVTVTQPMAENV